jgi:hypothetical protein
VGKVYYVEATIFPRKSHALASAQRSTAPIWFDIVLHPSGTIELIGEWQKRFGYDRDNPDPQPIAFIFRAMTPGSCSLAITFYHEGRWLRTLRLEFEAIAQSTYTTSQGE